MIKVTALTAFRTDPASVFRFRQFIAPLAEHGIDVTESYLPITRYRRQPLAALGILPHLPAAAAARDGVDFDRLLYSHFGTVFICLRRHTGHRLSEVLVLRRSEIQKLRTWNPFSNVNTT